jgi:ribosomal protein L11 methyltransferase
VIRLAVRCRSELAEAVLAELLVLAPGGIEEEREGEIVEYAIYGAPGEVPELGELEAAVGDGLVEVRTEEIPDDWADRWRDFHEPTRVGDRIVVRPSWHEASAGDVDLLEVVIDPGQAFGTGAHATTRMCLELLVELADADGAHGSLADLGTGSGVLAIAAAKLGFGPVLACDHELAALEAAAANARANGVEIACETVNLREQPPPMAKTLIANLTAPLLLGVAARLEQPPRELICSGLLVREVEGVARAFADAGLEAAGPRSDGDWAAVRFHRRDG